MEVKIETRTEETVKYIPTATINKDEVRNLLPENHIVIDFDLKGPNGETGAGIHLHYIYDGDVEQLERLYSEGIEIKVFTGYNNCIF